MSNNETQAPFRRIVTGHDAQGRAVILEDAPPPRVQRIGGEHGPLFFEVWNTRETPARIDRASGEPQEDGIQLAPPSRGTRIRVLEVPPEDASIATLTQNRRAPILLKWVPPMPLPTAAVAANMPSCTAPKPSITASCWKVKSH